MIIKLLVSFLITLSAFQFNFESDAADTVSWDCPPGDTSCDIQRDDPLLRNCGKFQKYNPDTTRIYPETKEVLGGYDYDGTPQYVGYGANYCDLPSQLPCPSPIYIKKRPDAPSWIRGIYYIYNMTDRLPGCYMSCGDITLTDNQTCYFLLNHTDYYWVDTNATDMQTLQTALRLPGIWWNFLYGRVWYKDNWRFGKVHLDRKPLLGIRFQDENGTRVIFQSNFQVLTCLRCPNGGTGQYCCKNGANNPDCCLNGGYGKKCTLPCGHLLPLDKDNNPDDPKTPGFNSGTYLDGSTVYPGLGFFSQWNAIDVARIQTSNYANGSGAYNPYGPYYIYDNIRPRYLVPHPNLKWIRTNVNEARDVPGAIKVFWRFGLISEWDYYTRMNFSNELGNFTNIGYLWRTESCGWNGTYEECIRDTSKEFDILVCRS